MLIPETLFPFKLSASAEKTRVKLNATWEKLSATAAKCQAELDRIGGIDPADLKPADYEARRQARLKMVEALQAEVTFVRDTLGDWPAIVKAERLRADADAQKRLVEVEAELTKQLTDLGYPDIMPAVEANGVFIPASRYIRFHPRYREVYAATIDVGNEIAAVYRDCPSAESLQERIRALTATL